MEGAGVGGQDCSSGRSIFKRLWQPVSDERAGSGGAGFCSCYHPAGMKSSGQRLLCPLGYPPGRVPLPQAS